MKDIVSSLRETVSVKTRHGVANHVKICDYDYDKSLRDKTKDLRNLEAQRQALEGVTNDSARSELARITAQIAEAQEDLADLRYQHSYDIQTEGYSKLSDDANEALDDAIKRIEGSTAEQEHVVELMLGRVVKHYEDAYAEIEEIIKHSGTVISNTANETLDKQGFSSENYAGLPIDADGNWTFNTSPEAVNIQTDQIQVGTKESTIIVQGAIDGTYDKNAKSVSDSNKPITSNTNTQSTDEPGLKTYESSKTKTTNSSKQQTTDSSKKSTNGSSMNSTKSTATDTSAKSFIADAKKADNGDLAAAQAQNKKTLEAIKKYILSRPKATQADADKAKAAGDTLYKYIWDKSKHGMSAASEVHIGNYLKIKDLPTESAVKSNPKLLTTAKRKEILNALKKLGYASGTLGVKKDEFNWTHEGELIRRSDGAILRQLKAGTQVIPQSASENLMKWAALNPAQFIQQQTYPIPEMTRNTTNVTNHYDSLLTVNGNVDRDALPELKEILKQACEYTNKYNAREARKLGKK